jgi:hypothetical protein
MNEQINEVQILYVFSVAFVFLYHSQLPNVGMLYG